MSRLSGYRYREIKKILKRFGFEFHRQAAGRQAQRLIHAGVGVNFKNTRRHFE
jgi:hypothetical protein